jgi:hypothetical protein
VWLVRLLSFLLAIGVLIVAIFLGGVILVTGAVLGVGLWGWLWWQRRKMMRVMGQDGAMNGARGGPGSQPGFGPGPGFGAGFGRGRQPPGEAPDDKIIEGDFEVLDDHERPGDHRSQR